MPRPDDDYRLGFESLDDAPPSIASLEIDGEMPGWLTGSLVRTGPAKFDLEEMKYRHWFDGLAMLHRFDFDAGDVSYRARFLESDAYLGATEKGHATVSEFGTSDPCKSLFGRAMSLFKGETGTDNANVNVGEIAGELVSMTETPMPIIFDRDTLETVDHLDYDDQLDGDITTAHPLYDAERDCIYNYLLEFGRKNRCRLYRQSTGERTREEVAVVEMGRAPYMHSFNMTRHYLVLTQFPLTVNPLDLVKSGKPFIENYKWQPERGTRFTVVDKQSGRVVADIETEPFFAFHHVNGFEDGPELVVDLVAYPDPSIIDNLYLDELRGPGMNELAGRLVRYRLDMRAGTARREVVSGQSIELPRIHPGASMRDYSFVWGNGHSKQVQFLDEITKIDVETGDALVWREPARFPGEPVFVPRPDPDDEDDGVLLSIVLDTDAGTSFMLVLDAVDLDEIARARLPHRVPFGFHGQYLG
jgi:carotenoid cleavage dioxygenase-like enzyme